MAPYFTVLIATKNRADLLRTALASVFDQTFRDFEVVVVNDGSTDHTLDVIGEFPDLRVKIINYESHGLPGAARNRGIEIAQGEWVAILDDDDSWYANKLERVAEAISSDAHIGVISHYETIIRNGKPTGILRHGSKRGLTGSLYDYMLLTGNIPSMSGSAIAREYLQQVNGFAENKALRGTEDYDLWLRLSEVCQFLFLKEVLGSLMYHDQNMTREVNIHLEAVLAVLDKHFGAQEALGRFYPASAVKCRYALAYYGAARQYYRMGHARASLAMFFRAFRKWPFFWRLYAGGALSAVGILTKKVGIR